MLIVIPYRNREEHLNMFIPYMKKYDSSLEFLVVEQVDGKSFNRGKLLNCGFLLMQDKHDSFCFHDVDMLPKNANYSVDVVQPTHFAGQASQFGGQMPYSSYFGGVTAFNKKDFWLINGYHNEYWGWGGEDDDLYDRTMKAGLAIKFNLDYVYESLSHQSNAGHSNHSNNCILVDKQRNFLGERNLESGLNNCQFEFKWKNPEHVIVEI